MNALNTETTHTVPFIATTTAVMYHSNDTRCETTNFSSVSSSDCVEDKHEVTTVPPSFDLDPSLAWKLKVFTNCIMINLICIFGIVGNSINIAVLRQHGFKETTNIVLVSLSTSDLLFNILVPVTRLKCMVNLFDEALSISVHTFVTVFSFMPKYVCLSTSVSYVVVIAIERFTAVFFPFKVSKIFRRNVTIVIVIALPTFCISSLIPTFLALTYEWVFDSNYNRTVAVLRYTDFYNSNHVFIDFYTWIGLNNFYCATSITIVTLCCLAIGFKLTRAKIKREAMTTRATGYDAKVVKMLVTVCVVYLATTIPTISMYTYFVPNFIFVSPLYELVDDVCVILHCVNASMNFIVYVTMSEKFAKTYKRLLACQPEKKRPYHKAKK